MKRIYSVNRLRLIDPIKAKDNERKIDVDELLKQVAIATKKGEIKWQCISKGYKVDDKGERESLDVNFLDFEAIFQANTMEGENLFINIKLFVYPKNCGEEIGYRKFATITFGDSIGIDSVQDQKVVDIVKVLLGEDWEELREIDDIDIKEKYKEINDKKSFKKYYIIFLIIFGFIAYKFISG